MITVHRSAFACLVASLGSAMGFAHTVAAAGPCTPTWDTSIGMPGIDEGYVASFGAYDDGLGSGPTLYATGSFDSAGGGVIDTGLIARWFGGAWQSVGGGMDTLQFSNTMETHAGELYVGGYFNTAAGAPGSAKLAKWNSTNWSGINAQLDQFDDSIWALKSYDDGSGQALYIGGNYQGIGGTSLNYIARWNGTSYTEVGGTIAGPVALIVLCLEEFNGDLYAGGRFTSIDGVSALHIARWDGKQWHDVGGGMTGTNPATTQVLCMTTFDDGNGEALYVGGNFTAAGGVPATRVAKWDGMNWSAVGDGFVGGNVNALESFNDGAGNALYATGGFTTSGVTTVNRLAKWNGTQWSMLGAGLNATGFALMAFNDGIDNALYIGGSFTQANGLTANRVVRYVGCPVAGNPADIAPPGGDGVVDVNDLLAVINQWGACADPDNCPADIAPQPGGDDLVDVNDLLMIINNWG